MKKHMARAAKSPFFHYIGQVMNIKKAISLLCVCLLMITGLSVMVKANTEAAITYRFVSARAGYAEGSVTLAVEAAGKYTLY